MWSNIEGFSKPSIPRAVSRLGRTIALPGAFSASGATPTKRLLSQSRSHLPQNCDPPTSLPTQAARNDGTFSPEARYKPIAASYVNRVFISANILSVYSVRSASSRASAFQTGCAFTSSALKSRSKRLLRSPLVKRQSYQENLRKAERKIVPFLTENIGK